MEIRRYVLAGAACLGILAALPAVAASPAPAPVKEGSQAKQNGFDPSFLDTSVSPCKDFFDYADGGWIKTHPIPPQYPIWGTFSELHQRNMNHLHTLLENAMADNNAAPGSELKKVGDFYYSGMDVKAINEAGVKPLQNEFDRIDAVNSLKDLQREVAHLQSLGVGALFRFGSMQDFKDSTKVIGVASQGGLSLPDRSYYLKQDPRHKKIRQDLLLHIATTMMWLGESAPEAAADARTVLRVETSLAEASMTRTEMRKPKAVYHPMSTVRLARLTPDFSWPDYFAEVGHPEIKSINVSQPGFFQAMNKDLKRVPLKDWKTYLKWHLISRAAPYLSRPFVDESFHFSSQLMGTKKNLPRWQRVINAENRAIGFAVGKLFVKKYFPPESKARVLAILKNIKLALKDDLETLSWMSPATRKQAIEKLDMITDKIGYPDKWRDYSSLKIDRGPYVLNVLRASKFNFDRRLNKIGKPVDRTEWGMTPQMVNAYYDPSMNEIVFPAGILQPPFFNPNAPEALNYGAIGAVIGHETTHGFDDEGSQYDGHGNLRNWWTKKDLANFKARAACIAKQYSGYAVDGSHLNGHLVTGEAIADLGGLKLAYRAYQMYLKKHPNQPDVDGFTPDQLFFLGFAHVWASHARPKFAQMMVTVDPHPPARFRVNGTLSDLPEFREAFSCGGNSPMVRKAPCQIW